MAKNVTSWAGLRRSLRTVAFRARRFSPLTKPSLRVDVARGQGRLNDLAASAAERSLGRVVASLKIDSRHHRLEGVGERRRPFSAVFLLHAAPHPKDRSEIEFTRGARERRLVDHSTAHQRTRALIELGIASHDKIGDREVDDGVTEKFETLVRFDIVLGRETRVSECPQPAGGSWD